MSVLAANGIISHFLMTEWCSILCMYHIFLILSSVNKHSSCLHVLTSVNNAAMTTGVHVSFEIKSFSIYLPKSGIAVSYGTSIFRFFFFKEIRTVLHSSCTNLHSHQQSRGFSFLPSTPAFTVGRCFDDRYSDWGEVISHCTNSFDLHFYINYRDVEHLFMCLFNICMPSLEKFLFRSSAYFLIGLFVCSLFMLSCL